MSSIPTKNLLKFMWQNCMTDHYTLYTHDQQAVRVIRRGTPTEDFGADFINAEIEVGPQIFCGDILMLNSINDWRRNGYADIRASGSIAMVVAADEARIILDNSGKNMLTAKMSVSGQIQRQFDELSSENAALKLCSTSFAELRDIDRTYITERIFIERLERKYTYIIELYHSKEAAENWIETFYMMLMRTFGLGIHRDRYEALSRRLPFRILHKHRESIFELEALLLGQAGLLGHEAADQYIDALRQTYDTLRKRYALVPLQSQYWNLTGGRPQNYPYIRLSQIAALISLHGNVLGKILEAETPANIRRLFDVGVSEYWQTHFVPNKKSGYEQKYIGDDTISLIIINLIVPFLFAYGRLCRKPELEERAMEIIYATAPESNRYTRQWTDKGIAAPTALHSQALLQISTEYCAAKRCTECPLGTRILKNCVK